MRVNISFHAPANNYKDVQAAQKRLTRRKCMYVSRYDHDYGAGRPGRVHVYLADIPVDQVEPTYKMMVKLGWTPGLLRAYTDDNTYAYRQLAFLTTNGVERRIAKLVRQAAKLDQKSKDVVALEGQLNKLKADLESSMNRVLA